MSYPLAIGSASTPGSLVALCRQRCANEGDSLLDDAEYQSLITEAYGELHALVSEKGARYFEAEDTITTTGAATYALPAAHLSTIGLDRILSGTTGPRWPVYGPIAAQERTHLLSLAGPARFFAIEGASIALYPVPPSGGTYKHLYVPQPVDYSTATPSTQIDLINIYGRKFVIWQVASVAQHKGSTSQQRAVDEALRAQEQLEYWACQRALTQPSYRVNEDSLNGFGRRYVDAADYRVTPP